MKILCMYTYQVYFLFMTLSDYYITIVMIKFYIDCEIKVSKLRYCRRLDHTLREITFKDELRREKLVFGVSYQVRH